MKVGLLADFAGAFATWGPQLQQSVEAYQALHGNSVQGPDKPHEIQFIYRDTASQGPERARQLAQELVLHDHVKFLCGLDLSPHAMALADISKEAKMPVVIMNAATSPITRMSPYFVRVSQTVPQDVAPLGPWAGGARHQASLHNPQRLCLGEPGELRPDPFRQTGGGRDAATRGAKRGSPRRRRARRLSEGMDATWLS